MPMPLEIMSIGCSETVNAIKFCKQKLNQKYYFYLVFNLFESR